MNEHSNSHSGRANPSLLEDLIAIGVCFAMIAAIVGIFFLAFELYDYTDPQDITGTPAVTQSVSRDPGLDVCKNIPGAQNTVPEGLTVTRAGCID